MFIFFWLLFSAGIALVARRRGRSGVIWFLISFVISPLLAGFIVMVLPEGNDGEIADGFKKRCPHCDEMIRAAANTCRFCGKDVPVLKVATDATLTKPDDSWNKPVGRKTESKPT